MNTEQKLETLRELNKTLIALNDCIMLHNDPMRHESKSREWLLTTLEVAATKTVDEISRLLSPSIIAKTREEIDMEAARYNPNQPE